MHLSLYHGDSKLGYALAFVRIINMAKSVGEYVGDEKMLTDIIELFGFSERCFLQVGDALSTIPKFENQNKDAVMSLVYLDFDLHKPTKVALDFIESCISIGGVIVLMKLTQQNGQVKHQQ